MSFSFLLGFIPTYLPTSVLTTVPNFDHSHAEPRSSYALQSPSPPIDDRATAANNNAIDVIDIDCLSDFLSVTQLDNSTEINIMD